MNYFNDEVCSEKSRRAELAKKVERDWRAPEDERQAARQEMTEIGKWFGARQRTFTDLAKRTFPVNAAERSAKLRDIIGEHNILYSIYYEGQQTTFAVNMFSVLNGWGKSLANKVAKAMQEEVEQ